MKLNIYFMLYNIFLSAITGYHQPQNNKESDFNSI